MSRHLRDFYGLKWNPFSSDIPLEGIFIDAKWEPFFWRVETLVKDGGFAMITGPSGLGKSITMRALAARIAKEKTVQVQELSRPQSRINDFYREMGNLFAVDMRGTNRYGGSKSLKEKWQIYIDSSSIRPVLLIDEAQEMQSVTMSELRLLTSRNFDSQKLLTVILAGDQRLPERFYEESLIPLGNRIRTRLILEPPSKEEMMDLLTGVIEKAGNPELMTKDLMCTLVDHSNQNPRILMNLSKEILNFGFKNQKRFLDESLFFSLNPPRSSFRQIAKKR